MLRRIWYCENLKNHYASHGGIAFVGKAVVLRVMKKCSLIQATDDMYNKMELVNKNVEILHA